MSEAAVHFSLATDKLAIARVTDIRLSDRTSALGYPRRRWLLSYVDQLLSLYELFPFHRHPLWRSVLDGSLTIQQVMLAETQHWIRTRAGQMLRWRAMTEAKAGSPTIHAAVLDTYLEECVTRADNVSHLDLVRRLLAAGGISDQQLESAAPTPGNALAIALYKDIGDRGAACHIVGAGAVEFYYSQLAPKIFEAYTKAYGISEEAAETYRVHGPMDQVHANRALGIVDEAVSLLGWSTIQRSVRDAFVATSMHYDGMLQATTGRFTYWTGND